jgi:hypothetical protein
MSVSVGVGVSGRRGRGQVDEGLCTWAEFGRVAIWESNGTSVVRVEETVCFGAGVAGAADRNSNGGGDPF